MKAPRYSKRHYEDIANLIATQGVLGSDLMDAREHTEYVTSFAMLTAIADRFANMFEKDSARFDRERFINACSGK